VGLNEIGGPAFTTWDAKAQGVIKCVQSLQAAWKATLKVKCPHCGGVHEISVRETYINGALQEVRRVHLGVDEQQHPHGH
jgi:phage FluMu protein Com